MTVKGLGPQNNLVMDNGIENAKGTIPRNGTVTTVLATENAKGSGTRKGVEIETGNMNANASATVSTTATTIEHPEEMEGETGSVDGHNETSIVTLFQAETGR